MVSHISLTNGHKELRCEFYDLIVVGLFAIFTGFKKRLGILGKIDTCKQYLAPNFQILRKSYIAKVDLDMGNLEKLRSI